MRRSIMLCFWAWLVSGVLRKWGTKCSPWVACYVTPLVLCLRELPVLGSQQYFRGVPVQNAAVLQQIQDQYALTVKSYGI